MNGPWLVNWGAVSLFLGGTMHGSPTRQELAARVALIALRAGMPARELASGDLYVVAPDATTLTLDDAVRVLADLPKPLRCEASTRTGAVVVHCQQISDPVLVEVQRRSADSAVRIHVGEVRRLSGDSKEDPLVLIYGFLESALVPLSALETWFRDYRVVPYAMGLRPPNALARAKGASAVMEFAQGEFRMVDDSLRESGFQ